MIQMSPSTRSTLRQFAQFGRGRPTVAVRAASFYAAIGLPMVYLPLIAGGVSVDQLPLVAALLAANIVALVIGHDHRTE